MVVSIIDVTSQLAWKPVDIIGTSFPSSNLKYIKTLDTRSYFQFRIRQPCSPTFPPRSCIYIYIYIYIYISGASTYGWQIQGSSAEEHTAEGCRKKETRDYGDKVEMKHSVDSSFSETVLNELLLQTTSSCLFRRGKRTKTKMSSRFVFPSNEICEEEHFQRSLTPLEGSLNCKEPCQEENTPFTLSLCFSRFLFHYSINVCKFVRSVILRERIPILSLSRVTVVVQSGAKLPTKINSESFSFLFTLIRLFFCIFSSNLNLI